MQGDLMRSRSDGMQWRKTAREVRRAAGRRTWAVELDAATAWRALGGAWRNKGRWRLKTVSSGADLELRRRLDEEVHGGLLAKRSTEGG